MELALYLIAGFIAGAWIARRIYHYLLMRRAQRLIHDMSQVADILVIAQVEQVDDMFFVYSEKTQEFLAQGRTWEEIRTHFKSRFPGKVCAIDQQMADIIPRLTPASE